MFCSDENLAHVIPARVAAAREESRILLSETLRTLFRGTRKRAVDRTSHWRAIGCVSPLQDRPPTLPETCGDRVGEADRASAPTLTVIRMAPPACEDKRRSGRILERFRARVPVKCRGGETADAVDSKSTVGNHMRVQVPPSAPTSAAVVSLLSRVNCGHCRTFPSIATPGSSSSSNRCALKTIHSHSIFSTG
jgi:hypothetical protein